MTNRWKRLTALMLILLTLLNAGSALAAEEFWKWGAAYLLLRFPEASFSIHRLFPACRPARGTSKASRRK